MLQCVAVCGGGRETPTEEKSMDFHSVLQCVAVCCIVLQCVWGEEGTPAEEKSMDFHGVLQCVAVCCSVLQCVAVCVACVGEIKKHLQRRRVWSSFRSFSLLVSRAISKT